MALELLGNIELTPGQLAQLRALDRKYAQRVYTLLHDSEAETSRELTEAEVAAQRRYQTALQAQRDIDWARYGEEMRRLGEVLERLGTGRSELW